MKATIIARTILFSMSLAGCATNPFLRNEFSISADELTRRVETRFPIERNVAGLVDITFSRPIMSANDAEKRLHVTFDIRVRVPLSSRILNGKVDVSGVPTYDTDSRGLYLRNAKVDRMLIDNMPASLSAALANVASQMAKSQFEERPLHNFKPEDFVRYGTNFEPAGVEVRGNALVMLLRK